MDPFKELQKQARAIRDDAIEKARQEYHRTLDCIRNLEREFLRKQGMRVGSIAKAMDAAMPRDRPFDYRTIRELLTKRDGTKHWRKRSITNRLAVLHDQGVIKRLRRGHGTEPAVFAVAELDVSMPFQDMTISQVIQQILGEQGPMRAKEIAVAMLEGGWHSTSNLKYLCKTVTNTMRAESGLFVEEGGKWGLG